MERSETACTFSSCQSTSLQAPENFRHEAPRWRHGKAESSGALVSYQQTIEPSSTCFAVHEGRPASKCHSRISSSCAESFSALHGDVQQPSSDCEHGKVQFITQQRHTKIHGLSSFRDRQGRQSCFVQCRLNVQGTRAHQSSSFLHTWPTATRGGARAANRACANTAGTGCSQRGEPILVGGCRRDVPNLRSGVACECHIRGGFGPQRLHLLAGWPLVAQRLHDHFASDAPERGVGAPLSVPWRPTSILAAPPRRVGAAHAEHTAAHVEAQDPPRGGDHSRQSSGGRVASSTRKGCWIRGEDIELGGAQGFGAAQGRGAACDSGENCGCHSGTEIGKATGGSAQGASKVVATIGLDHGGHSQRASFAKDGFCC